LSRYLTPNETILIVAKSARLIADYLWQMGYKVLAADCFADDDLQHISQDSFLLNGLDLKSVKHAISQISKRYRFKYVVYGSGFEQNPDSLFFLQQQFTLLGNSADVFSAVQDKRWFFEKLDSQGILHPKISFEPPVVTDNWLQKPHAGEGGLAIRYLTDAPKEPSNKVYYQQLVCGQALSAFFLATSDGVEVVGIQQQLHREIFAHPFVFSGVISRPDLLATVGSLITPVISKLTRFFCLKGLNSVDFIYQHPDCYVLEINARPSASLQLYDCSWIQRHLNATIDRELIQPIPVECSFSAYEVIFAVDEIKVTTSLAWPEWIVDRPALGTIIKQNEPICSIICRANTYQQLISSLQSRKQALSKLLNTGKQEHAIYSKC
jgi:uncharacterized protein